MRLPVLAIALVCSTLFSTKASASAIILGTDTLITPGDLTVIKTETGAFWQWLDLTTTSGYSIEGALDAYSPYGFHWATGAEVSEFIRRIRHDLRKWTRHSVPS